MKTLKNIKVGDKIFVLFDNTILAEPSEIKILTVEKKGRKFIYSGHYKFNIEYGLSYIFNIPFLSIGLQIISACAFNSSTALPIATPT